MYPAIAVVILIVRLLMASGKSGGNTIRTYSLSLRSTLWFVFLVGGFAAGITALIFSLMDHRDLRSVAVTFGLWLCTAVLLVPTCFGWPLLRSLARKGNHKLVYYLGHLFLVCPRTNEMYAGPALLAALALAHRGNVTKPERKWLKERIDKEKNALGAYACARAMHEALLATAARERGEAEEAQKRIDRARSLLGSVTYLSEMAISSGIRSIAYEWLALLDATTGQWGSVMGPLPKAPTTSYRALRSWAMERFQQSKPDARDRRARKKLGSPVLERLHARPQTPSQMESAAEARCHARETYSALVRGETVGPRASIQMLLTYDVLLHPSSGECVIPEALREDLDFVEKTHEEMACALAEALKKDSLPLHTLARTGPVSARVHQKLERHVTSEFERALASLEATFVENRWNTDAYPAWLEASRLRALFRRVEYTLGDSFAALHFGRYMVIYSRLGVKLSEDYPRMRPLAHAVFASLHRDAVRFNNHPNVPVMARNMAVTRGIA